MFTSYLTTYYFIQHQELPPENVLMSYFDKFQNEEMNNLMRLIIGLLPYNTDYDTTTNYFNLLINYIVNIRQLPYSETELEWLKFYARLIYYNYVDDSNMSKQLLSDFKSLPSLSEASEYLAFIQKQIKAELIIC